MRRAARLLDVITGLAFAATSALYFAIGNAAAGLGWAMATLCWLTVLQKQRQLRRERDGAWVRLDRKRRMVVTGPTVWALDDLRDVGEVSLDGER
jgi:hypothetical protein